LLELARYSRGSFKLNLQPIHVKSFLEEVIARFTPSIEERSQHLTIAIADQLPVIELDPSRLEQVLVNLLSNASKFTPHAGHIEFRAFLQDGALQVEVQDDGIGISPEDQKSLFKPYYIVDQDRKKYPGLGLGLTVCKQIVEAHGGVIRVASQPGQGSTFSFNIPLR
jgi:signal transduction histidine kinase